MKLKLRKVDTVHETYMGVIFKVFEEQSGTYANVPYSGCNF